jgi:hypothetical protein
MKKTLECTICGHKETKNGHWNAKWAMEEHLKAEHLQEYIHNKVENDSIDEQIRKLDWSRKYLFKVVLK